MKKRQKKVVTLLLVAVLILVAVNFVRANLSGGRINTSFRYRSPSIPVSMVAPPPCTQLNPTQTPPYRVTSPGSYCLTHDIAVNRSLRDAAIIITSGGVTLDLNGHSITNTDGFDFIAGYPPQINLLKGISIVGVSNANRHILTTSNVVVRNGTVVGFDSAVSGTNVKDVLVENMTMRNNGSGVFFNPMERVIVRKNLIEQAFTGVKLVAPFYPTAYRYSSFFEVYENKISLTAGNSLPMGMHGISILGAPNVTVRNNTIVVQYNPSYPFPPAGISIHGVKNGKISTNEVMGAATYGIDVQYSEEVAVLENSIRGKSNSEGAIRSQENNGATFSNNKMKMFRNGFIFENGSGFYSNNYVCGALGIAQILSNTQNAIVDGGGNQLAPQC